MNRGLGRSGTFLLGGLGTLTPLPPPDFFTTEVELLTQPNSVAILSIEHNDLTVTIQLYEASVIFPQTEIEVLSTETQQASVVSATRVAILTESGKRRTEVVK